MKCIICGNEIKKYGNSPYPISKDGECCNECNLNAVVPYRIFLNSIEKKNIALLIKTDGTIEIVKPKEKYFSLKELQKCVDGYIEIGQQVFEEYLTVVNEEGLLLKLPFNNLFYQLYGIKFYGNVLICPLNIFEKTEE